MGNHPEGRGRASLAEELELAVGVAGVVLHGIAGRGRRGERFWGARHVEGVGDVVMAGWEYRGELAQLPVYSLMTYARGCLCIACPEDP